MAPCSLASRVITAKIDTPTSGSFEVMGTVAGIDRRIALSPEGIGDCMGITPNDDDANCGTDDREWCARLMATSEPWVTLGRDSRPA